MASALNPAEPDRGRLPPFEVCARALDARDPRFDGVFFVGITTTRVYCRPVCPARVSHRNRRRFFSTAAAAERAGYRPCLRCRPELAPGRATIDAVSRLAWSAARRIEEGALNEGSVPALAAELGVTERHLRRAVQRELGVSPSELALTHRLLLAKRLLRDTSLSVTRVAYASGFQSLRRFNDAFRIHYRLTPSQVRRSRGAGVPPGDDQLRLALTYRPPLAWQALLTLLDREALPCVERVTDGCYRRNVRWGTHRGGVVVESVDDQRTPHLVAAVSSSLVPAVMPLIAGLRRLLDLDAEPAVIDAHLARAGLGAAVAGRPGIRIPGALDPFEAVLAVLLRERETAEGGMHVARRVVWTLGEPCDGPDPELTRLPPRPEDVVRAGAGTLAGLGLSPGRSALLVALAEALLAGRLRLGAGVEPAAALMALVSLGVDRSTAGAVVMRALAWPDADPLPGGGGGGEDDPLRPWRAYGAAHRALAEPWRDQVER